MTKKRKLASKNNKKGNRINNKIKEDVKNITNERNNKNIEKVEIKEDANKEIKKVEETKKKIFFKDNYIFNLFITTLTFFIIELIFKIISDFEIIAWSTLRIFLSTFILAFIINFFSSLTKRRWIRNTINLIFIFAYTLYAWLQIGFINYLGVYISFNTSSQFGAVTDYIYDFLSSFKLLYFVIFIPFIVMIIWYFLLNKNKEYIKLNLNKKSLIFIPILLLSGILYYGTLKISFMQQELQIKSNIKLFKNPDVPTIAVNQFGTTVFGMLDLKSFLVPNPEENSVYNASFEKENQVINREVSEILENIAKEETNKKYTSLNNYFASQKVTDYNDYTGMFKGKNVVVILMESVNEAIINEEYFPNFTNLYNNGWHWENTYSPRNSCATGNNEFSALTSLYSIYNTCTANVYKKNTYFESIFNLFNNSGYTTRSMHNFTEWYYYRSTIHPNMGSGKYYGANDLKIKTSTYGEWPSDIEFFEKAFDIILNDESGKPWMTWLTTVTSHQPYSSSSTYGDLYMKDFKELGYSTTVSRYLSKLKVLDEAIGVMVEKLKNAGVFEDTVIVMLADHYPYGLNKTYISEIIDHDLTDYEIEKTPFVIYNPKMDSKTFSEYNSYINLVPTIANLMNLEYDPRLYMGTDLLSEDYESLVVFADGSWKNEIAYYNASTSKIKYYGDVTYTVEELQKINETIDLKISMSSKAIKNNYFNYLENKIKEYEEDKIKENETMENTEK